MKQYNSVDLQHMIVSILGLMVPEELIFFISKVNKSSDLKEREYLLHCISFASKRRIEPEYCRNFENTCKTILMYQESGHEIGVAFDYKKIELVEKLGWENLVQLNRIENGRAIMPFKKLNNICSDFASDVEKRFWLNQLMHFFPGAYMNPVCEFKEELSCFRFILDGLSDASKHSILERMEKEDKLVFDVLHKSLPKVLENVSNEEPSKLYGMIKKCVEICGETLDSGMTLDKLIIEELQTSKQTWYNWKKIWEEAESAGFNKEPKPRIQRRDLLLIAVATEISLLDTMVLLYTAGYCIGADAEERDVFMYLSYGTGDAEEIKAWLRNNRKLSSSSDAFRYI